MYTFSTEYGVHRDTANWSVAPSQHCPAASLVWLFGRWQLPPHLVHSLWLVLKDTHVARTNAAQHASQLARVRLENLELQEQMQRTPRYEVEVATGTARGAGTNSHVYVDLVGRSGHRSGERQLTNEPEASMQAQLFKRGSRECFLVCCADIGVVSVVLLRQDASGTRPHWLPDWLRVRKVHSKGPLGPWTEFPLGTWLSADKGMRTLSLRLEAGQPPGNWITCAAVWCPQGECSCSSGCFLLVPPEQASSSLEMNRV